MSYVITVDRIALGDDFRARAEHEIQAVLDEKRGEERSQAVERFFDGAAHRREVPADSLAQLRVAEGRSRASAAVYERQAGIAAQAELLYAEAKGDKVEGTAAHLTSARTSADRTLALAKADEVKVLALKERLRSVLDPALTAHVASTFDRQIASGLDAVVVLSNAVGSTVKVVRFQISGHVEDDGTGFLNVHVWPAE